MKITKVKLHLYDLEMFSRTSMCDFYRAYYIDRFNNVYYQEGGFLSYSKKDIKKKLREMLCETLNKKSQYIIYN